MKAEIPNRYPDRECFFCGPDNHIGLHLKFYLDDDTGEVSTNYLPDKPFGGLGDILHGGIQAGLFDEIMGWTAHHLSGQMGVTSEINVRFIAPVYLGSPVLARCRIAKRSKRKVHLEADISRANGTVCSRATGVYHLLPRDQFDALVRHSSR